MACRKNLFLFSKVHQFRAGDQRKELFLRICNSRLIDPMLLDIEEPRVYCSSFDLLRESFTILEFGGIQRRQIDHRDLFSCAVSRWGIQNISEDWSVCRPKLELRCRGTLDRGSGRHFSGFGGLDCKYRLMREHNYEVISTWYGDHNYAYPQRPRK